MIITDTEYLLKDKDVNNFFKYLPYLYCFGFTIFMMYVSYRSMNIMEDAMNKMNKYECISKLLLHDLNVNVSMCGYKKN